MKLPKTKRAYLSRIGYTEEELVELEAMLEDKLENEPAHIMSLKNGEFMRIEKDEFDVMKLIFATKKSLLLKSLLGDK